MFATRVDSDLLYDRLDAPFYNPEFLTVQKKLNQYKLTTLESVSYTIFDPPHIAPEFTEQSPYQMIMIENLTDNGIEGDFRYITENCHLNMFRISHLEGYELLMTRVGATSGTVGVVTERHKGLNASGNLSIIKIDSEKVDRFFIFVYFNSNIGKKIIKQQIANTARDYLTIERIKSLPIPIIPKYIQTYIGNKVRKAEELRERAKENRREYTSLIDNYFSNVSKDKFPKGSFIINCQNIDSKSQRLDASFYNPIYKEYENLDIEYKKLGDLVKAKTNINPKSDVDYFYYEIGDMSNNVILDKEETIKGKNLPSRAKLNLSKYDIIVSLVQGSEVTSFVDIDRENMLTTNGCAVLAPKDISIAGYLYAIVSSPYFIAQKCRYISGTNIRSLSKEDLLQIPIPIFEYKIIEKINDLVKDEYYSLRLAKQLIREAKQDVEDLIEGKFDESKISEGV